MRYANDKDERESNSKGFFKQGSMIKRLIVMSVMAASLAFAGAQSMPAASVSSQCQMTCSEPYIDPSDGQCYIACCPADPKCTMPCERIPCK